MLLPSLIFGYEVATHWPNPWLTTLLLGSLMHLPSSVAYHLASAFWKGQTHTDLRRLDQSMIHLAGSVFALALSRGSALYSATHLCHSLFCISRIKRFGRRNWIDAARSVFLWLLPMAGHWEFVTAAVAFFGGGLCFIPQVNKRYLRGWGHTLFHLGVAGTAWCMCRFVVYK